MTNATLFVSDTAIKRAEAAMLSGRQHISIAQELMATKPKSRVEVSKDFAWDVINAYLLVFACIWYACVVVYAVVQYFGEQYYAKGGKEWIVSELAPVVAVAKKFPGMTLVSVEFAIDAYEFVAELPWVLWFRTARIDAQRVLGALDKGLEWAFCLA